MARNTSLLGFLPDLPTVLDAVEAQTKTGYRAKGPAANAVVGAAVARLLFTQNLSIEGVGPFVVAGPVRAAFAGAAARHGSRRNG